MAEHNLVSHHERMTVVDVGATVRGDTQMEDGMSLRVGGTHLMEQVDGVVKFHRTMTNDAIVEGEGKAEAIGIVEARTTQRLLARRGVGAGVDE